MSDINKIGSPCAATDGITLRHQIMDSSTPKNEREWWAKRAIDQLETLAGEYNLEINKLTEKLKKAVECLEQSQHIMQSLSCFNTGGDGVVCFNCEAALEEDANEINHTENCELKLSIDKTKQCLKELGEA